MTTTTKVLIGVGVAAAVWFGYKQYNKMKVQKAADAAAKDAAAKAAAAKAAAAAPAK